MKSSLNNLKKLIVLDLSENLINEIEVGAFDDLISLEKLSLSDNQIVTLDPVLFLRLETLKHLSLRSNKIFDLDENLLKNNKNLRTIWLENNKLSSISSNLFKGKKSLIEVDLRGTCIDKQYVGAVALSKLTPDLDFKCSPRKFETIELALDEVQLQISKLTLKVLELEEQLNARRRTSFIQTLYRLFF